MCRTATALLGVALLACPPASAADGLSAQNFVEVHRLIKPGAGESLWLEVPWLTNLWEARQQAAAAGKPILLWSGGGAAPIGGC